MERRQVGFCHRETSMEREHLEWLWDNWRGEGGWRTIVNGFGTIGLERRS